MALSDIRAAIAPIIAGVSGVEIVYNYNRRTADWRKFIELFKTSSGKINGWMFSRVKTPAKRSPTPYVTRDHMFLLRGIYGVRDADASALVFDDQVEAVQSAFDSLHNLNGCSGVKLAGPAEVEILEDRVFGSVLCHYARIALPVSEKKSYE